MKPPLYLDYAATTPVDPRVAKAMSQCLTLEGNFGNPASRSHVYGWRAEEAVEDARGALADLISADPREIVWTSGATESNNLAIKGALLRKLVGQKPDSPSEVRHIVTSKTEHKAVLDTCAFMETQGYEVTYITPPPNGVVTKTQLEAALRTDTALVSLMHVNNEIGVIHEIEKIGTLCRERGILFHVDAAQSLGKVPVDVRVLNVDLLSLSAHKMYGPKGIGALYVRRDPKVNIDAQIHGGGHERGMRSGTLPTHQIVGLGEAAKIAQQEMAEESKRLLAYRERFLDLLTELPDIHLNGDLSQRVAGNVNISFAGVEGENLLMSLRELALSTGSACTSVSVDPSYVLTALGLNRELASSALRICFGRFTKADDVDFAAEKIIAAVKSLRSTRAGSCTA
ncbi:MAG: IscS subfamily cysteine desulfurase [Agarilytica sp.]